MKTTAFIAVRTGSSRLPAKALMPVLGKPMLERMIERVRRSRHIDDVVIATTHLEGDDRLEALAQQLGIGCFRGSVDDVLGRMSSAVAASGCERVVELLGDNPLVHADIIDDVIDFHEQGGHDYAVNVTFEQPHAPTDAARFPIGVRVEVYWPSVIARCASDTTDPYHREHSTSYIGQHPELFKLGYLEAIGKWEPLNRPGLTFAVNYHENFELVEKVYGELYLSDPNFTLMAAMDLFNAHPEWARLMEVPTGSG